MQKQDKIFIAGGTGMVGSAIIRALQQRGHTNLIANYHSRLPQDESVQWKQLDLTRQEAVQEFFQEHQPDYVVLAAAKVGGIYANNTYPADFIYDNLIMESNVIHAAHHAGVQHLLFLGSSCIYPREAEQPMSEETLLTGPLEPTNEPYAVAKIAGIKLCESYNRQHGRDYRSVMPTNLYGPGDNFDLETSHVIPAIIRKMHLGKCLEQGDWQSLRADLDQRPIAGIDGSAADRAIIETLASYGISLNASRDSRFTPHDSQSLHLTSHESSRLITNHSSLVTVRLWGTGTPMREFLHVDDMASACMHVMNLDRSTLAAHTASQCSHINIGTGQDCTIRELAGTIQDVVGYTSQLTFDTSMPDGTPRKLLDVSRLKKLGWEATISLREGIENAYRWYMKQADIVQ
jgi:GDP-L-fucose synthase